MKRSKLCNFEVLLPWPDKLVESCCHVIKEAMYEERQANTKLWTRKYDPN